MKFNNIYLEEFTKLLQDCYNNNSKLIIKNILDNYNSKKFFIINIIPCYRMYYNIFNYEQPYKQECKLFIDNYGNTYGFGWNLWEKNYLYIFNINLHNDKQFYYNNDFNEIKYNIMLSENIIKQINNEFKNVNWYDIDINLIGLYIKNIKTTMN